MSKEHVIEELSAYIDGEADDPARIARHLQLCESCARHHMQLLKLSAHLQALPQPEARPEFLTRVLAHTAETPPRPHAWQGRFAVPGLALAATLLLVAGWAWHATRPENAPAPAPQLAINAQWNNDDAVVEAFSRMIETGTDTSLLDASEGAVDETLPEVSVEEVIDVLAYASWEENEGELWTDSAEGDLFSELDTMDSDELEALRAELYDYLTSGNSTENQG